MPLVSAEAKRNFVLKAMNDILYEHDEAATRANFSEGFLQHNPASADGIDHLVAMTNFSFTWEHARWIVDGDIVVYHGMYSSSNPLEPTKPLLCVDMWRLDGDKIVEHWDALMIFEMGQLANKIAGAGDGMKEGTNVAANKAVVSKFISAIGNHSVQQSLVTAGFIHHTAEGNKGLAAIAKEEILVKKVIGSGDLVMVHSLYKTTKKAAFDWFLLEDGKIAEHWNVQQDIAEETENPHPHF